IIRLGMTREEVEAVLGPEWQRVLPFADSADMAVWQVDGRSVDVWYHGHQVGEATLLGARTRAGLPRLTEALVLAWADQHQVRTGTWPGQHAGPVHSAPGETWSAVDCALRHGGRGLPGGSSLAQLLAAQRGARNRARPPRLTLRLIRVWAIAHRRQTGAWPRYKSGPVAGVPGETWRAVEDAPGRGLRGLPGRSSLARLFPGNRGKRRTG